jgi:hypothetical protein
VIFLGDKSTLPAEVMHTAEMWSGCVSGALELADYKKTLAASDFEDISVEVTQVYEPEMITGLADLKDMEVLRKVPIASAFIRARKSSNQ